MATFVDMKKAFDTVNHAILINKLAILGLSGCAIQWIQNYLENRTQRTYANGSCLEPE